MTARALLFVTLAMVPACTSSAGDAGMHPDANESCPQEVPSGSACAHEAQSCPIEGTGTCDQPPAGGTCTCTNGTWACQSGCADGCPTQLPGEGSACTLAATTECRYYYPSPTRCSCTNNAFRCY